jgi:3',5'-cyclic AMP phosphodiesterase CpdA
MTLRMVAVTARLQTEMEELKRAPRGSSVWKLHADSLVVLGDLAKHIPEAVARLTMTLAQSRAEQESNAALHAALEKLRERARQAATLVAQA